MKNKSLQFCALLLCFCPGVVAFADELQQPFSARRMVDLTHVLHRDMPFWPGTAPFVIERLADYDKGYRMHRFSLWENIGTHIDAPAHFIEGGASVNELGLNDLVAPVAVINVQDRVALDPDYQLSVQDVLTWEERNGRVRPGSLVVMNTGWYKKFSDPKAYVNQDETGVLHFPGFSVTAAQLLVERDVAGIGIDTLSLDPGNDLSFPVHKVILEAGKFQVENMNNLDALPAAGAVAVIGVLPVKDASQAQARIFAFME
jgi:kynurenine formamidase